MPQGKAPRLRIIDGGDSKGRISAGTSDADADNDLPFDDSGVSAVHDSSGESSRIVSAVERSSQNVMMGRDPASSQNIVEGNFATGEMPQVGAHAQPDDEELSPFEVDDSTKLNLGEVLRQLEAEGVILATHPEDEKKISIIKNVARTFVLACKKHAAQKPGNIGAVILELLESALVDIQTLLVQKQLVLRRKLLNGPQNQEARENFLKSLEPQINELSSDFQNEVRTILEESQRYLPYELKTDFAHYSLLIFEALFKGTKPGEIIKPQKNATLELATVLGTRYASLTEFCASIHHELVIVDGENLDTQNLLISREVIPTPAELFERTMSGKRLTIEDVEAISREIESVPYYTVAEITAVFGELHERCESMWSNESLRRSLLSTIQEYVMAGVLGQKKHQANLSITVAELLAELEDEEASLEELISQHPVGSSVSVRRGNLSPEPTAATSDIDEAAHRELTPQELADVDEELDFKFDLIEGVNDVPQNHIVTPEPNAVEVVVGAPSSEDVDALVDALDELESKHSASKEAETAVTATPSLPETTVAQKITISSSTYRTFTEKILSRRALIIDVLKRHPEHIDQIIVLTTGIRLIMKPINMHVEEGRMDTSARDGLYKSVEQLLEQSGVEQYVIEFCLWAYQNAIDDESIRVAYTEAVSNACVQAANAEQLPTTDFEEKLPPDLVETTVNSLREKYPEVDSNFTDLLIASVRNALIAGRSGHDKRSRLSSIYEELATDIQSIKNLEATESAENLLREVLITLGITEVALDIMFDYKGRVSNFHTYLEEQIAGDVFVATFTDDVEEIDPPVIPDELPSIVTDPSLSNRAANPLRNFPSWQRFGVKNKQE